jgi:uncharacterized protein YbjT (DUF2867 family)
LAAQPLVLVTGATGYVGGKLVPRLLDAGYRVRVLVRDPMRLRGHPWRDRVEVVRGDTLSPVTLPAALFGATAAYYLIHSLASGPDYYRLDATGARNFGAAAREAGVGRIIYLGGLGDPEDRLSRHLRSRQRVGELLRASGVPVTEFRAAIIIGAGSVSFRLMRYLADRLPIMLAPRWVYTRIQPISIQDVLSYLVKALEVPESAGKTIEIGGATILTYRSMMMRYAQLQRRSILVIPVPALTPRLSSYWVGLITPIPPDVARPLILGLRNEVVVRDNLSSELFPEIKPMGYMDALRLALEETDGERENDPVDQSSGGADR